MSIDPWRWNTHQESDYIPQHCAAPLPQGPWLVLAPHPDDETFGMGGAIALAVAAGITVHIIVLTDGALGGEGIDPQHLVAVREQETQAALSCLGVAQVEFWREPDRGLVPCPRLIQQLSAYITSASPTFASVFFPSMLEPHPDHRAAAVLAWETLRQLNFPAQPIGFDISVQGMSTLLVDITPVMAQKLAAMRCHASQEAQRPYHERILALNRSRTWSLPTEVQYAESFNVLSPSDRPLEQVWLSLAQHWAAGLQWFPVAEPTVSVQTPPTSGGRLEGGSEQWQPTQEISLHHSMLPTLLVVLPATEIGGAEIQTAQRVRLLQPHFNLVLLTQNALAPLFAPLNMSIYYFDDYGLVNPFDYSRASFLKYARAIAEVARDTQAAVIYGVMHMASIFLSLARWRFARTLRGRVCIGSLHGSLCGYFQQRGYPVTWMERGLIQLSIKTLHSIIVPSQALATELIQDFGAKACQLHPIHNGFDVAAMRRQAQQPLSMIKDRPWVVTSCRLTEQKDFKTLLTAFAQVVVEPAPYLLILGEGSQREFILECSVGLDIEQRVLLLGFQDNPFPWLQAADIFVLASFYEGFGNVLVEAMILGVPVIASDCPWGPAEILQQGQHGVLFPTGDYQALAQALTQLLTDTTERERIAAAARLRADDFSLTAMVDAYTEVFTTAVAECERLAPNRQRNP